MTRAAFIPPQIPNPNSFAVDMDALKLGGPETTTAAAATTQGDQAAPAEVSKPAPASANPIPEVKSGWNLLAQALDRVLFVLYLLIIVIFMGAFFGGAAINDANNSG